MAARQPLRGFPYQTIAFDVATTGDHELRALVAGKHIVVMGISMVRAGAVNVKFSSDPLNTGETNKITGDLLNSAILAPMQDQNNEYGLFWTAKGEALSLNLDANVAVSGYLLYCLADSMPATLVV